MLNITSQDFTLEQAVNNLEPLVILTFAIVIYAIVIFKFYRYLARKDILSLDLDQYNQFDHPFFVKFFALLFYLLKYIIIFPIIIIFWFLIFSVLLAALSSRVFDEIFLISMAIIAATRISAFYNEDLSKDLGKMIPFALLGVAIIDTSLVTMSGIPLLFSNLASAWKIILYYLAFTMALELILRIVTAFKHAITGE